MKKRLVVRLGTVICAVLCLFMLAGCTLDIPFLRQDTASATADRIFLALYTDDAVSPYEAFTRTNRAILSLCYNGLIRLDDTLTACPDLAASWETDGDIVTVKLRSDAKFADGSRVTSFDCVASFDLANADNSVYRDAMSHIVSYEVVDAQTLSVTFDSQNVYNVNLLDIPIVKSSAERYGYAVGAGRYYMKDGPGDTVGVDVIKLYVNPYCVSLVGTEPEAINVRRVASHEDMLYAFNYGNVDVLCSDFSDGTRFRTSVQIVPYSGDDLAYMALNSARACFRYKDVSCVARAISALINRETLGTDTLKTAATAVWYTFSPAWSKVKEAGFTTDRSSAGDASLLFYAARWYRNADTKTMEWFGEPLRLVLIVRDGDQTLCAAANSVCDSLNSFGIGAELKTLTDAEYVASCADGSYDIRFDTVTIPRRFDLVPSLVLNGVSVSASLTQKWADFLNGEMTLTELNGAFLSEMPVIPLYVENEALCVNRRIRGQIKPCAGDLFGGIETWKTETEE